MLVKTIKSKGLAHNSYFLADGEEALVVDPRRDCTIYTELAKRECVKIKYVLETHRNEDYVIGSLELQNLTDAEIAHSRETTFKLWRAQPQRWRFSYHWTSEDHGSIYAGTH